MLSQKYRQALDFAAGLHHGHMRKGTEIDYLSHLLSVSALVMEHGGSEDEAIAGLLHDALEDQGDGYQSRFHVDPTTGRDALKRDLALLFGTRVRDIVIACTDDEDYAPGHKSKDKSVEAWRERKERYLAKLRTASDAGILRVSSADKLHNARAILSDYVAGGEDFWLRFAPKVKSDHLWYYGALLEIFAERAAALGDAGNRRMAMELRVVVNRIRDPDRAQHAWAAPEPGPAIPG
jgi:(p)ppGpp synthase/HD superfamily hydrolase